MTDRFTVQDKQYMELNPVSERQRRGVTGFASGRIESEMKQSFMEVEMVMKKKWMVLMTLTMSLTAASAVRAGAFDDYVDYQNPDGTYSYYFDQGVLVTLDENWYQNTIVKTSDRGATFYQKASYDAYEKEGMEGGRLFTIGASVNSSFSELPSFEYIGFDEDSCMNYYAELPTDYQAYMGDASIQAEYDALWSQVKDVIAGIRIGSEIHAGNETVDVDGNGLGEDLTSTDAGQSAAPAPVSDTGSEPPYVYFSDWREEAVSDTSNAYSRDITVSDGGNYIMTWLKITGGERYYYQYDPIWQGKGVQKAFSHDWDSEEIRIGKLFRFETMEECDMDIDQIITDHVSIQASDGSSFILVFRPKGGKYDGTVQTVTVMNGRRDLVADSYKDTESIEMLGVLRFPEEERSALHFGENIIQPDSTGFQIQMSVLSDVNDGIALMVYTNSSGNEVCVAQPVMDGFGVLTAYDGADTAQEIRTGHFGILGYNYDCTDALFEGIDFDYTTEVPNLNQSETPNLNQPETGSGSTDLNKFLTGGLTGGLSQDSGTEPLADGEHRITLEGDVFEDCPSSAKAGETVTVHTGEMADGRIIVEMNGTEIEKTGWGTFTFTMPDEDVVLKGYESTYGFPGA